MNTTDMNVTEQGQKIDMQFDQDLVNQFRRGDFTGVRPVILQITPITNIRLLLGLAPDSMGSEQARAVGAGEAVRREEEV